MFAKFKANLARAHKSWTMRFNVVMGTALHYLPDGIRYAHDSLGELKDYTPATFYTAFATVIVIGNILLRFKTNTGLSEK